jgi:hypothetical protein
MMNKTFKYLAFSTLLASSVLVIACKTKKTEEAKVSAPTSTQASKNADSVQLLNVRFFSIGSGIDYKSLNRFDIMMTNMQREDPNIVYNKYPWGREGEVDCCIEVSRLPLEQKRVIEDSIRMVLSTSTNTRLSINKPCRTSR